MTLALAATSAPSRAAGPPDDVHARARDAYDRGTVAYRRGEWASAAREFARADAIEPTSVALQAALDAATLADDAALGAELLARVAKHDMSPSAASVVAAARARFAGRAGRIHVVCPRASSTCLGSIDGLAFDAAGQPWVAIGPHSVVVQFDGSTEQRLVRVDADVTTEVTFESRASTPRAVVATAPPDARGLSPAWFFVGVGVSVILAGVAVGSAADADHIHGQFVDAGCGAVGRGGCAALASSGQSADRRTLAFAAAAGIAGAATTAFGLFAVRWRGAHATATATPAAGGAAVALSLRFR